MTKYCGACGKPFADNIAGTRCPAHAGNTVEPHIAFAEGRLTVENEERNPKCPYIGEAARFWHAGRRDALSELALNADTEWDID